MAAFLASIAAAAPVSIEQVQKLAGGVASSVQVSYASGAAICMAQEVSAAQVEVLAVAPTNSEETAFYVVDRGAAGGFVVMSADDRLDPVLVIAPSGKFDAKPGSPLYDILCDDVPERVAAAHEIGAGRSAGWSALLDEAKSTESDGASSITDIGDISDVRVSPIVQSKWNQSTEWYRGSSGWYSVPVYNYYTPPYEAGNANNYVCGCVATAGSQIMRYHEYPRGNVTPVTRTCSVGGTSVSKTMIGGTYSWGDMPLVPGDLSSISDTQRKAIGKLCYDMGVSVYMSWNSGGSGAVSACLKDAFLDVFGYRNAMTYQISSGTLSSTVIQKSMLANFDAGYPVEIAIRGSAGGHAIVGDGYGYSGGNLYIHLNLGWSGSDDAWYNLPNVDSSPSFSVVRGVVYNIFPDKTGDLLTGRVVDASTGNPIAGATVQAFDGNSLKGSATSSETGVYAILLEGGKTYSVVASKFGSETSTLTVSLTKSVTTTTGPGVWYLNTGTVGNSWGNDFSLAAASNPVAPEPPTGLSASDGTSTAKIRVTWNASSEASYYKVYRALSDSASAATCLSSSVTTPYYDDTSADVGTTYWYWVKAGNSIGESGFSSSDSGWRAYAVPSAPTGVSATDGTYTDRIVVTWSAVSSATSYSVYRATSSSSAAATQIASGIATASFTDTSAVAGTTYWYWVKATNQGGTSGFSAYDTGYRAVAAPAAPTGVSASKGLSSTEIVVSWNAVASATSYSVWRGTSSSSSSATQIASGLTATSYSDTSAVAGTTYYYWVKATNSAGTSGFSGSDTGYLAVIVGPSTVAASDGSNSDYVRVTWSASQNATSYEVWRGTVNAYSSATKIASPTATSYNDSSATPGMLYYYWVRAVTSAGTSAFSASDSGYRPLSAPGGVSATTGNSDGVTVSWSSVTGATSYQVGRGSAGASAPADIFDSVSSLSYKDATAVPGVTYAYFVRAVASAGAGPWSASAAGSRSVPTPTNLTASDGTYTDRILVTWPALSGAQSYELVRSDENDIAFAETIANVTGTSFSDTTAEYGLTYYYFLRARFAAGTSPWSASEAGFRAFPAPTGLSASDGLNTARITVSWDAIEGATLFQVWRYSDERGRNELIGTSTSTSYNDSKNLVPGVRYTYRVKAVFLTGTSAFSAADTGYLKSSSPTVVASDGTSTSQISLTWSESAGAVAYYVYRGTSSSSASAVKIATKSMLDNSYTDTAVAGGTLYYYWVLTSTAIDTSDFGTADTGYVALPGVSRVTASDGTYADKVVVSWGAVSGATSYEVWRGASDEYSGATRVTRNVTGLSWDDTDVTPGMKCWYWVRACDAGGVGLWGASDSGWRKLSAPTDVTATTNQTDGVKVSWKGTTSGVSFEIRRGLTADASQASVVATVSDKSNYTDNTTVPGYRYWYWVRAYSDLSESAWSSSAEGYRAVSAPATVSATDGTSLDAVTITWTAATSAKRYEIWRNTTTKTESAELIGTTNKLVWVDAAAEPGVAYYYWIKSVSALDTSAFSNRDKGYVSTPAPTGVMASDGLAPNLVRIDWAGAAGAASYAVWRAESDDMGAATEVKSGVTATTYDDTSVTPGKFYWYWVRSVSVAGPGVFAGPDCGFALLSAPTEITASTNSETRVTVSWKKAGGAAAYEVFRAETNDVTFATNEVFATVTTTSYADTNAVPAVKYWYWVRAVAEADVSPLGGPGDGFRLLSVPTGVSATDGTSDEFIKVTWNETWGAESYEVWRAVNSTSTSAASLLACVTNELEYIDATAEPGVSHTYWVKAVSELHTTGFSANDKGWRSAPAPATVLASDGTTSEGVIVDWPAVGGAIKYEVWRNDTNETSTAAKKLTTSDATVLSWMDTSAKAGVRYWYWVRTVSTTGTGVFSESDDGFRAVAAPTSLQAADGASYDYVRVTWKAAAGAESYEVCRSPTNEIYDATVESFIVTGTVSTITFDDTNAVPGVVYSYRVRTVATLSTSDFAGPDNGYRKLSKVTDVIAGDGASLDAVNVTWTVPVGARACQVWRSTSTSVGTAVKVATVEGGTYSDVTALHGEKYYYWVNGVADVEGEMGSSNDGWRAFYAPGNVVATDGDSTSHTRITWAESADATSYKVLRGNSNDPATMSVIATLNASAGFLYEDSSGVAGSNYWYSVRAVGTGGESEPGVPDSGYKALVPPTGVSATDGTQSGKVIVTWRTVTGAAYYRVYRADSDAGAKDVKSGWLTGTSYTDTSVKAGVRYWYYVVAAVAASDNPNESRPSAFSGGDSGYSNTDGSGDISIDLGNGITWPVADNGDGTTTTNVLSYTAVDGGRLMFSGIEGEVGAKTTVQAMVKTALGTGTVYTVPAELTVVSKGEAELDLSSVWGTRPSLFVIGITTEPGEVLP